MHRHIGPILRNCAPIGQQLQMNTSVIHVHVIYCILQVLHIQYPFLICVFKIFLRISQAGGNVNHNLDILFPSMLE